MDDGQKVTCDIISISMTVTMVTRHLRSHVLQGSRMENMVHIHPNFDVILTDNVSSYSLK